MKFDSSVIGNKLLQPLNPSDGAAYRLALQARNWFYVSILLFGLTATFLPSSWFSDARVVWFVEVVSEHWPKLKSEREFLNAVATFRGEKYTLFHTFMLVILIFISIVHLPILWKKIRKYGSSLTVLHKFNVVLHAFWLVVFVYFFVFDGGMITSSSTISRGIGRSHFIWFWSAINAGLIFHLLQSNLASFLKPKEWSGHDIS